MRRSVCHRYRAACYRHQVQQARRYQLLDTRCQWLTLLSMAVLLMLAACTKQVTTFNNHDREQPTSVATKGLAPIYLP